jgi:hypothetical protein
MEDIDFLTAAKDLHKYDERKAIQILRNGLAQFPDSQAILGQILKWTSDPEEKIGCLRKLLTLDPGNKNIRKQLEKLAPDAQELLVPGPQEGDIIEIPVEAETTLEQPAPVDRIEQLFSIFLRDIPPFDPDLDPALCEEPEGALQPS